MQEDNFEPTSSFPIIEFTQVPFDLQRVQLALFDSTYRNPATLLFPKEHADVTLATDVAMTVELVHAIYEVDENDTPPAECYDTPEWYLRGVAHFTGPTGEPETAPMHVLLLVSDNSINSIEVQIVTDLDRLKGRIVTPDGE